MTTDFPFARDSHPSWWHYCYMVVVRHKQRLAGAPLYFVVLLYQTNRTCHVRRKAISFILYRNDPLNVCCFDRVSQTEYALYIYINILTQLIDPKPKFHDSLLSLSAWGHVFRLPDFIITAIHIAI